MSQWHYTVGAESQGPVEASELANLLVRGTINGDTLVWKDGMAEWQPLHQTELMAMFMDSPEPAVIEPEPAPEPASSEPSPVEAINPTAVPAKADPTPSPLAGLESELVGKNEEQELVNAEELAGHTGAWKNGANWLYWIVGLTVLNLILILVNSPVVMALGLVSSELIVYSMGYTYDAASDTFTTSTNGLIIAGGISAALCVLLGVLGWLANSGSRIAYIIGMAIFAIDTLLFFLPGMFSIIGLGFHCYALFQLFLGLSALLHLHRKNADLSAY